MGADSMGANLEAGTGFLLQVITKEKPGQITTDKKLTDVTKKQASTPQQEDPFKEKKTPDEEKPKKKSWIKNKFVIPTGLTLTGLAALGGGYAVYQHSLNPDPAISRPAENQNPPAIDVIQRNAEVAPFNMDLLDKKPQTVKTVIATPEQIKDFIGGPQPEIVDFKSIKTIEDMSRILLILPIGQEAGKVKVWRVPTKGGFNGKSVDIPMNLVISVENEGARFGPVIPEGINTSKGELFIRKGLSKEIDGKLLFFQMYIKYKFDNDKYAIVTISSRSLEATGFLKNAPFIDTGNPKNGDWLKDIFLEKGLEFDILDNPALFLNTSTENDIYVHVASYTESSGYGMLPELKTTAEGNLLTTAPR